LWPGFTAWFGLTRLCCKQRAWIFISDRVFWVRKRHEAGSQLARKEVAYTPIRASFCLVLRCPRAYYTPYCTHLH
jgi:hypothetical protein